MMPCILLTGFRPFGGAAVNPSELAVRALDGEHSPDAPLHTAILPVTYSDAVPTLLDAIARTRPDIVLATGLSGSRADVAVETLAINLDDARIADNNGERRRGVPIIAGGPASYPATLPTTSIMRAICAAGIPAVLSSNAGTFLCNNVFYRLCHLAATSHPGLRAGFIHLPALPTQPPADERAIARALAPQVQALRIALAVLRDSSAPPAAG